MWQRDNYDLSKFYKRTKPFFRVELTNLNFGEDGLSQEMPCTRDFPNARERTRDAAGSNMADRFKDVTIAIFAIDICGDNNAVFALKSGLDVILFGEVRSRSSLDILCDNDGSVVIGISRDWRAVHEDLDADMRYHFDDRHVRLVDHFETEMRATSEGGRRADGRRAVRCCSYGPAGPQRCRYLS
jgi:hypothetical protein